jgi:hypothetical protein
MRSVPIKSIDIQNALDLSSATDDELYRQIGSCLAFQHPYNRHHRIYFKTRKSVRLRLGEKTSNATENVYKRERESIRRGRQFFLSTLSSPAIRRKLCRGDQPARELAEITDGGNERELITAILAMLASTLPFIDGGAAVSALVPLAAIILKKGLHRFCQLTYRKKTKKKKKKKKSHDYKE